MSEDRDAPMEVELIKHKMYLDGKYLHTLYEYTVCPSCSGKLVNTSANYCHICGQRVDFQKIKEAIGNAEGTL